MKRKYALPSEIITEISSTIDLVKNNIGTLNYKIVPIDAIEFDPNNPRELAITRDDLPCGPNKNDLLYEKKMQEFELLKNTAETIKKYGVRNAIEIYKYNNTYRLIHGERRCLSSILAGKKEIPAKILDKKPSDFDIRLLQLIENVQREDLTLYETLNNIRQVIDEYKNNIDSTVQVDTAFLENLINKSKTQCLNFLAVLNAPDDLHEYIKQGRIRNLEKAAIIAKAKTKLQRDFLLKDCLDGASLKQLKQKVSQQKAIDNISQSIIQQMKKPGKKASKINLGATTNKSVISKLVKLVSTDPLYAKFTDQLNHLIFNDYDSCSSAFSSLIKIMEKVEVN